MDAALALVWHFWIGVALAIPAILITLTIALLYVVKVEMPRYNLESQPTTQELAALDGEKALES